MAAAVSTETHPPSRSLEEEQGLDSWGARLAQWRRELLIAVPFSLSLLSICLSSGLLAFSPLGPDYVAKGITLGLFAIIFGGICTALLATSSFIVYSPRSNLALIQATAATHFLSKESFAHNPEAVIVAMAVCVFLAGLLQILFAVGGIARIIKYTPHPVMAGFINGAALAIAWSQIKPFIDFQGAHGGLLPFITQPATLAFIVLMALFIFGVDRVSKKIPAPLVGLVVGVLIFYLLAEIAPNIQLGRMIGNLSATMPPESPFLDLATPSIRDALMTALPDMLFVALAIAVIATFESLLVFRVAQNLADKPLGSRRNVVALGAGNCASALVGGIAFSAANGQTRAVYREGGRTRAVPIAIGLLILLLITGAPGLLAAIPVAAISALLLQNTFQKIDMWSIRLLFHTLRSPPSPERRRAWYDLAVVGVVMGVTVTISVLPGVLAGVLVACVIFIANMSRPIVRRRYSGEAMSSKRMRSAGDAALLRETGSRRLVLELHGVLFFGNADDLSTAVSKAFAEADMIVLDFRGISDIDVSGATILRNLVEKSRKRGMQLLFCNVPAIHAATITTMNAGGTESSVFPDLDSTLEWMEERVLRAQAERRAKPDVLPLEQHDFLQGLAGADIALLAPYLSLKELPAGATLCVEGDQADRMWLLMKGSVSVRLRVSDLRGSRRIASCATGTTVGEMAFVESGTRSASVVTDEDTVCYEFERAAFDRILQSHPDVANKLLTNLSRELARRVRRTSEELREMAN
jgi:MFS superfamily sulfate permease-like transporter